MAAVNQLTTRLIVTTAFILACFDFYLTRYLNLELEANCATEQRYGEKGEKSNAASVMVRQVFCLYTFANPTVISLVTTFQSSISKDHDYNTSCLPN